MEQQSPPYIRARFNSEGNGSENYKYVSIKFVEEFQYLDSTSSSEELLYHEGRETTSKDGHQNGTAHGEDGPSKKTEEKTEEEQSAHTTDREIGTLIKAWQEQKTHFQSMIQKNDKLLDLNLRLTQEMSVIKNGNLRLQDELTDLRLHVENLKRDLKQIAPICTHGFEPYQDSTVPTTQYTSCVTGGKTIEDMKIPVETNKSSSLVSSDLTPQDSRKDDNLLLTQACLQTAPAHLLGFKHMRSAPDMVLAAKKASAESCHEMCKTIDSAVAAEASEETSGESNDPNRFQFTLMRDKDLSTSETEDVSPDLEISNADAVSKCPVGGNSGLAGEEFIAAISLSSDYNPMSSLPLSRADLSHSAEENPLTVSEITNQVKTSNTKSDGSKVINSSPSKSSSALQSFTNRETWGQVQSNTSGHLMDGVNLPKEAHSENLYANIKKPLTFKSFSSSMLNERMPLDRPEDPQDVATTRPFEALDQETSSGNRLAFSPTSSSDKQTRSSKLDSDSDQELRDRQVHSSLIFATSSLDEQATFSKHELRASQGLRDRQALSSMVSGPRSFLDRQSISSKSESHANQEFRGRLSHSSLTSLSASRNFLDEQTASSKPDFHASRDSSDKQPSSNLISPSRVCDKGQKTFSNIHQSACQNLRDGQSAASSVSELASCDLAANSLYSISQGIPALSENGLEVSLPNKKSSSSDSCDNDETGKIDTVSKLDDRFPLESLPTCRSSKHRQVHTSLETSGLLDERSNCFAKASKSNLDEQSSSTSLKKTTVNMPLESSDGQVSLDTKNLSFTSKAREYWTERDVSAVVGGAGTKQFPRSQNCNPVGPSPHPVNLAPSCLPTVGPYMSLFRTTSENKETISSEVGFLDSLSQVLDTAGCTLSSADVERYDLAEKPLKTPDAAMRKSSPGCTINGMKLLPNGTGIQNRPTENDNVDVEYVENIVVRQGMSPGEQRHGEDPLNDTCCTDALEDILTDKYSEVTAPCEPRYATAVKMHAQKEVEFHKKVTPGVSSMENSESPSLEEQQLRGRSEDADKYSGLVALSEPSYVKAVRIHARKEAEFHQKFTPDESSTENSESPYLEEQQLRARSEDKDSTVLLPECIFLENVIYHPEADIMVPGTLRVTQDGCNKSLNFKGSNVSLNFCQDLSDLCLLPTSSLYRVSYQEVGLVQKTFLISFELASRAERLRSIISENQRNEDDQQFFQSEMNIDDSHEQTMGHEPSGSSTSLSGKESTVCGLSYSMEDFQPENMISLELVDSTDRQCNSMPGAAVDVSQLNSLKKDASLEPLCRTGTFVNQAGFPTEDSDMPANNIAPSDDKNHLSLFHLPKKELLHGHFSLYPKADLTGTESPPMPSRHSSAHPSYRFLYPCTLDILRERVREKFVELYTHVEKRTSRSVSGDGRLSRGEIGLLSPNTVGSLPLEVCPSSWPPSLLEEWETKFGSLPPHHKKPGMMNHRVTLRDPGLGLSRNLATQHLSNYSKPRDRKYSSLKSTVPHVSFSQKLHDVLHQVDDNTDDWDAMDRLARNLKTSRVDAKTNKPVHLLRTENLRTANVCGPTAQLNQSSNLELQSQSLNSGTAEAKDVKSFPLPSRHSVFTCKAKLMDLDVLDARKKSRAHQCADTVEIKILRLKEPGMFKVIMLSGTRICASHFISKRIHLHSVGKNNPSSQTANSMVDFKMIRAPNSSCEDAEPKIMSSYHQNCCIYDDVENGKNTTTAAQPDGAAQLGHASRSHEGQSAQTYCKDANKVRGPNSGHGLKPATNPASSRYLSHDMSSLGPGWRYVALDTIPNPMSMRHFVLIFPSQKLANGFKVAFERCRLESRSTKDLTQVSLGPFKKPVAARKRTQQDANCSCVHVDVRSWTPDAVMSSTAWGHSPDESSSEYQDESDFMKPDDLCLHQLDCCTSPGLTSLEPPLTKDFHSSASCCSVDESQELHLDSEKSTNVSTAAVTTAHMPAFVFKKSPLSSSVSRSSYSLYHEEETCLVHKSKYVDNITCSSRVINGLEELYPGDTCRKGDNFCNLCQVVKCSRNKGERKGTHTTWASAARQMSPEIKAVDVESRRVERVGQALLKHRERGTSGVQKNGPTKLDKAGTFLVSCRPALTTRTNVAGLKPELQVDSQILRSLNWPSVVAPNCGKKIACTTKDCVTEHVSCQCQVDDRYASVTEVFVERTCSICGEEDKVSEVSDDSYLSFDDDVNASGFNTGNNGKEVQSVGRNSSPDDPELTCMSRGSLPADISQNQTGTTISGQDMTEHVSRVLGSHVMGQGVNGDTKIAQFRAAADSNLTCICCKATQSQTFLQHFHPLDCLSTSACRDSDVQKKRNPCEQMQKSAHGHKPDQDCTSWSVIERQGCRPSPCTSQEGCASERRATADLERQQRWQEDLWACQPTDPIRAGCCTSDAPSTIPAEDDVPTVTWLSACANQAASLEQRKKGCLSEPQRHSARNRAVPDANIRTAVLAAPFAVPGSYRTQAGRGASVTPAASQPLWMTDEVCAAGMSSSCCIRIVRETDGAARLLVSQLKNDLVLCSRRIDPGLVIIPPASKPPGKVVRLIMSALDEGKWVKVALWLRFRSIKMASQFIEVLREAQRGIQVNKNR